MTPAGAPVFAGWRALPVPPDAKGAALHYMNALRELRMAHHAAAVLVAGVTAADAVRLHTPHMAPIFGWTDPLPEDVASVDWDAIEATTNRLVGSAFTALDDGERAEFVELANVANSATA